MNALNNAHVVRIECSKPLKVGYGAKSVVTVVARVDAHASLAHDGELADVAETLAQYHAPEQVMTARRELGSTPANWRAMHFELQLV